MELDRELETFQKELPRLLKDYAGKYALVFGDRVDSIWDTEEEALDAGDDRFGLAPYLVKRILKEEPVLKTTIPIVTRCPSSTSPWRKDMPW
jgi:hypothetical protein